MESIRDHAAYINRDILCIYEHGVVFERSTLCIRGLTVYLSSDCSHRKPISTSTILLWYPFCHIQWLKWVLMWQYKVLLSVSSKFSGDLKPYLYSFSCHGYLQQGSWLEATINSALSILWQICLQTDLRDSRTCWHTPTDVWTHIHAVKFGLTHTVTLTVGWQRNRDQCNLLQHSPKPLSSPIYLSIYPSGTGECVKSILHSFKEQPAIAAWLQRWPRVLSHGP